jgi:hypothetical protein
MASDDTAITGSIKRKTTNKINCFISAPPFVLKMCCIMLLHPWKHISKQKNRQKAGLTIKQIQVL